MSVLSEGVQAARTADQMIENQLASVNAASNTAEGVKADKLLDASYKITGATILDGAANKALQAQQGATKQFVS